MPVKKTKSTPRESEKRTSQEAAARGVKSGKAAAVDATSGAAVVPQPNAALDQLQFYEAGMRLFHAGKYSEARDLFLQSLVGSERDVAHRADLHIRMCERRLEVPKPVLHSADDHYNYGVAMLNARDLAAARYHLQIALAMDAGADHIYYALALCHGLAGDLQGAYENLRRAIELQPRNRISARQDADFAAFVNSPPFDRLLHPEKK